MMETMIVHVSHIEGDHCLVCWWSGEDLLRLSFRYGSTDADHVGGSCSFQWRKCLRQVTIYIRGIRETWLLCTHTNSQSHNFYKIEYKLLPAREFGIYISQSKYLMKLGVSSWYFKRSKCKITLLVLSLFLFSYSTHPPLSSVTFDLQWSSNNIQ